MLKKCVKDWARNGIVKNPDRIKIVNSDMNFSIWAQDSAWVVGNKTVQQERVGYPGYDDMRFARELARVNPEIKHKKVEGVFIDGGNQLADRDKIFVGIDAIAFALHNMKKYPAKYEKIMCDKGITPDPGLSKAKMMKLIMDSEFPHQKVTIVGHKGTQPSFHIDMAMTPLGKKDPETGKPVMLLGDPSLAIGILNDVKKKSPGKYNQYQKEIREKVSRVDRNPLNTMISRVGEDKALQESLDTLAKGFEKDGYKVERVPYLGGTYLQKHPWFTYNNSVIDGDNVFIPNFGIPELDEAGNGKFKKYGYTPIPVEMSTISSLFGAINCITKVVEREYA
jgi:hypothetical protein